VRDKHGAAGKGGKARMIGDRLSCGAPSERIPTYKPVSPKVRLRWGSESEVYCRSRTGLKSLRWNLRHGATAGPCLNSMLRRGTLSAPTSIRQIAWTWIDSFEHVNRVTCASLAPFSLVEVAWVKNVLQTTGVGIEASSAVAVTYKVSTKGRWFTRVCGFG
jgi:hypothetical protein